MIFRRTKFYYAVIDLRNADVFILDGTVGNGSTTTTAGAAKGTNVLALTATTGFAVGSGITVGTSIEYYVITAINTLNVTVTPALTSAVASAAAVVEIGNLLEVKIGEGTLTYSEKRGVTYVLNRGHIYSVKLADDAPVEVGLQFIWEFLRSASGQPPTVEEALKQIGGASAWVSSDVDACAPYSVDIIICYVPPCGDTERIALRYFRWESLDHDLKAGTVDIRGNCNVAFAEVTHGTT